MPPTPPKSPIHTKSTKSTKSTSITPEEIQTQYNYLRTLWLDATDNVQSVKLLMEMKAMQEKYPDIISFESVPFGNMDTNVR